MKQPKFKFGDMVAPNPFNPFTVNFIQWDKLREKFFYKERNGDAWLGECLLSPYQKPEKFKLFAFQSTRRHHDIMWKDTPHGENAHYKRAPMFDKYIQ